MDNIPKPVIGITLGDINGIGPELVINTFSDQRILELFTPVIYGSTKVLSYYKNLLKNEGFNYSQINDNKLNFKKVNVVNCWHEMAEIQIGKSTKEGGKYALLALEKAIADVQAGKLNAIVTCPINKENIQSDDFRFPGHTEFLQSRLQAKESLMLMVSETLKIGVATGHIPLNEVSNKLTKSILVAKLKLMERTLINDFGTKKPKIAVLGLNPHAGENGVIGKEDIEITSKAIEDVRNETSLVFGPYAADGFFGSGEYKKFDAIMAMYHDQGLVPFKSLAFGNGVNFTAGLPITRTSPDHGTAYSIVGKNIANIASFREAVFTAINIIKSRKENGLEIKITKS